MITLTVPEQEIADALGFLGDDVTVLVWDMTDEAPEAVRENAQIVCVPHYTGGRKVFARISALEKLRVVQLPSAGYEHALGLVPEGVALSNARGVHDTRTAEFAIALALASQRRIDDFVRAMPAGEWNPPHFIPSLADRRSLVIGYGSIGQALGKRLRAMEVPFEALGRRDRTAEDGTHVRASEDWLERMLPHAEIVFLVTPHNEHTDKMVNAEFLSLMQDGALLVNVGRGKCVDTDALVAETSTGRLRAALDVTEPEPLPSDHPLWQSPGVIIAPHVAGGTPLTDKRYLSLVAEQVHLFRIVQPPTNLVETGGAQERQQ